MGHDLEVDTSPSSSDYPTPDDKVLAMDHDLEVDMSPSSSDYPTPDDKVLAMGHDLEIDTYPSNNTRLGMGQNYYEKSMQRLLLILSQGLLYYI